MKRISALFIPSLFLMSFCVSGQIQQKIGGSATSIAVSATLEIESTSRGFLPPRMTKAQRNAIVSPVAGLIIYCTNCGSGEPQVYNGSSWLGMSSFAGGSAVVLPSQSGSAAICDGSLITIVVELTSSTGKVWMDRNLGASRAGTSATDYFAYGCLYQWGRGNDGHASINWSSSTAGVPVNGSTTTPATTDVPGNALFITNSTTPYDWRSTKNDALWQVGSQVNNPCNVGFHVPTDAQLTAEFAAYSITNAAQAYANGPGGGFKFVLAGNRGNTNATLNNQGVSGNYWSSSVNGVAAYRRYSNSGGTSSSDNYRAFGFALRCLKD